MTITPRRPPDLPTVAVGASTVSSASRRLCLVLTVDPRKDPPSRLKDEECTDLPLGHKEIDLDDREMDGDPVADSVGGRPSLLTWS